MHKLYDLKDMLCEELSEYGGKENLDLNSLEIVDKLAHALKNVEKIISMHEEEEYSERGSYDRGSYDRGGDMNYRGGTSYAAGRGRNARRDSMGRYSRYSRDGGMVEELRELMHSAPDEHTRQDFEKLIQKIEGM